MINNFKPTIHILDGRTEKIVDVLDNTSKDKIFWSDNHHMTLENNEETYEFNALANTDTAKYLKNKNKVIIKDYDGIFHAFTIEETDVQDQDGQASIYCYCEAEHYELGDVKIVYPVTLEGATIETAVNTVLADTRWRLGVAEYSGTRKVVFDDYLSGLEALYQLASNFGLSVQFRVDIGKNSIINRWVDFVKPDDLNDGKEFVIGKDLKGVTRKEDTKNVCTRLIGLGQADEDGKYVTFESVNDGKIYVEDKDAYEQYNINGQHIYGIYKYEGTTSSSDDSTSVTPQQLLDATKAEIKKRNQGSIDYEIDPITLERITGYEHEKIRLGFHGKVKDTYVNPPIYVDARVIEVNRSYTAIDQDSFTLGYFNELHPKKPDFVTEIQKTLFQNANAWNGKATIIDSPTPPTDKTVYWLDTTKIPNVLKRWDNDLNDWVKATPTEADEVGAETPDGAQQKATDAKNEAVTTSNNYTDNKLKNYVDAVTYSQDLNNIQSQIDGNITSWFYGYDPTLNNAPANAWKTTDDKNNHLGDLFYNTTSGYAWRFALVNGVYQWIAIKDTDIQKALQDAAKAQDTADSKRRVFLNQPTPPYDAGDMWKNGYTVYACITSKASGSFSQSDWQLVGDVTSQNTAADTTKVSGTPAATVVNQASAGQAAKTKIDNDVGSGTIETTTGSQQKVDNVKVGGRNIIPNSDFSNGLTGWRNWGSTGGTRALVDITDLPGFSKGIEVNYSGTGGNDYGYAVDNIQTIVGQVYTFSAWVYIKSGKATIQQGNTNVKWAWMSQSTPVNQWFRMVYTFTAQDTTLSFYLGSQSSYAVDAIFTGVQVELGNKETAWTRAQEDIPLGNVKLPTNALDGQIDLIKNMAKMSGNYNNAQQINGQGLLLENNDQTSPNYGAMYIGPGWWLLANSKDANGNWKWGTAATGLGMSADMIKVGYMLFDRLQGGTLTLGGVNNQNGELVVLNSDGDVIADLDAANGGFQNLYVGNLSSPSVYNVNEDTITYNVSDRVSDTLLSAPKMLGDGGYYFTAQNDITDNIKILNFTGEGTIQIDLNGHKLNGNIVVRGCSGCLIQIMNGTVNYGGENEDSVILVNRTTNVWLENLKIYGNNKTSSGVDCYEGGSVHMRSCEIYNVDSCINAYDSGIVSFMNCKGKGTTYGVHPYYGGITIGTGTSPGGGVTDVQASSGVSLGSFSTNYGSATPPAPPETTKQWQATSGAAWRPNFGGQWYYNQPLQGSWSGYGPYYGLWFFDSSLTSTLNGKTIVKARIKITRQSKGGSSGKVPIRVWYHNYASKPSGQPSFTTEGEVITVNLAWGDSTWVNLPSSWFNNFADGSLKGIGIYNGSTGYAYMSSSATLEVTYK